MESLASLLNTETLPQLGTCPSSTRFRGIKDWIAKGAFTPEILETGKIILTSASTTEFTGSISSDYERFALSALESYYVAMSEQREFKSASWPILKLYYSSFFSAHAILRSSGGAIIHLDWANAANLSDLIELYSPQADVRQRTVTAGSYFVTSNLDVTNPSLMTVELSRVQGGRGVHEGFWIEFVKYIEGLAACAVSEGYSYGRDFINRSNELKRSISGETESAAWISSIRNKINYQHEFHTWMPLKKRTEASTLFSMPHTHLTRLDLSAKKLPLNSFVNTIRYIANLNLEIGNHIASRSTKQNCFGGKWNRLKNHFRE